MTGRRTGRTAWAAVGTLGAATVAATTLLSDRPARDTGAPSDDVRRAAYTVVDKDVEPRLDEIVMESTRVSSNSGTAWRLRVEARHESKRAFAFEITTPSLDFLQGAGPPPVILSYSVALGDGPPRSFVSRRAGDVLTPTLPWESWLPRATSTDLVPGPGFREGTFLGRRLLRAPGTIPPLEWATGETLQIELDPDVLIATSRDFRDDGTGRHGKDWRWAPLNPADYKRMIDAGFNLFRARPADLAVLIDEPVFLVAAEGLAAAAGLPLLPNFLGAVMYADEPASRARADDTFRARSTPSAAANDILERSRQTRSDVGKSGAGHLSSCLAEQGVEWGALPEARYPFWEAIGSASWYQLESGAGGWCYESRLDPATFAANVERWLGVPFPRSPDACVDFHLALFRGAARRFDAQWGVAVYGQTAPAVADILLTRAYDAGATYFWFWTSDGDHHVPHARQLELSRQLRAHMQRRPRTEGAATRTRSVRTAVVIPWGYTFDSDTFLPRRGGAYVWGIPGLPLDGVNKSGAQHRDVLRAAMRVVVDLLERGETWDTLFLRDDETAADYDTVYRVSRQGTLSKVTQ